MQKKVASPPKSWRGSGFIFKEGLKTSAKKIFSILSLIILITSICSTARAKSVYEVDTSGGGAPENVPRPSYTGVGQVTASAVCSSTIVTFRTDSCPNELDLYQPCNGGDNIIDFFINVHDVDVFCVRSVKLTLAVWDVDYECGSVCGGCCERDSVYLNGHRLTIPQEYLIGAAGQWSFVSFDVDPEWIVEGDNYVQIFIDTQCHSCWCLECDWGELALELGITLIKADDVNDSDCVGPGHEITYTIRYSYLEEPNVGDINDVNLIDYLPDEVEYISSDPCGLYDCNSHTVTWSIGTLEPNESGSVTLTVKVECPEPGSKIINQCELKSSDLILDSDYEDTSICINYLVVDDFERYTDSNSIGKVWRSYGGSHITISTDPCVPNQRHTGAKAMAFIYDNNNAPYYSETYADTNGPNSLDFGTDWTIEGAKALGLWFHGIPDVRGSFSYTGTDPYGPYTATITADGLDIWGTADQFHYAYRQLTDAGYIQARVDDIQNSDASAKAGVMMRKVLDPPSKYVGVFVTPGNGVTFQVRDVTGGTTSSTSITGVTTPHWIRLTRRWDESDIYYIYAEHANDVSGSPDKWEQIGNEVPASIPSWPYQVYIGLCVTSHNYGVMCDANFSNVTLALLPGSEGSITPNWQSQDIGIFYTDNDPEPMYVVLKDSDSNAIWFYPDSSNPDDADPNVTRINTWTQWLIDLNDFHKQGVDLTDVHRMYIGFGNRANPARGGSGLVYIDDIRLYSSRCLLEDKPIADFSCDCAVDYWDLKIMADEWLSMRCPRTDLYKDYIVDFRDLAILADNWLEGKPWP